MTVARASCSFSISFVALMVSQQQVVYAEERAYSFSRLGARITKGRFTLALNSKRFR